MVHVAGTELRPHAGILALNKAGRYFNEEKRAAVPAPHGRFRGREILLRWFWHSILINIRSRYSVLEKYGSPTIKHEKGKLA